MSNPRLPQEHELQLLKKLSTDDDYRARFEKDPVSALKELGIDDDTIAKLDQSVLAPCKLAAKSDIAATRANLLGKSASDQICLVVPALRVDSRNKD